LVGRPARVAAGVHLAAATAAGVRPAAATAAAAVGRGGAAGEEGEEGQRESEPAHDAPSSKKRSVTAGGARPPARRVKRASWRAANRCLRQLRCPAPAAAVALTVRALVSNLPAHG